MYCKHCGKEIEDGSKFCNYCGGEQESQEPIQTESLETSTITDSETQSTGERENFIIQKI